MGKEMMAGMNVAKNTRLSIVLSQWARDGREVERQDCRALLIIIQHRQWDHKCIRWQICFGGSVLIFRL